MLCVADPGGVRQPGRGAGVRGHFGHRQQEHARIFHGRRAEDGHLGGDAREG